MAVTKKKKKPTNGGGGRSGELGAMVRPSGEYDKDARPLTAREIAENKRKRAELRKKKKGK